MGNTAAKTFAVADLPVAQEETLKKLPAAEDATATTEPSLSQVSEPPSNIVIVTSSALREKGLSEESQPLIDGCESLISSVSDYGDFAPSFCVKQWDCKKLFSDMIQEGLRYQRQGIDNVIMLFESPSTAAHDSSFFNGQVFKMHDYPPSSSLSKGVLGPCRYALMNGNAYPSFLRDGAPPAGLMEHWATFVPGFVAPSFVPDIPDSAHVYAYLPVESIANHVNDPHVHYHIVGKDAIPLMTHKTTKLLPNTHSCHRPCIAKTTHSMGSKGIFVICNDEDEAEFNDFLAESGNPNFVVTELVEIERNVACHFFIHPSGEITWIGSNENFRMENGNFSSDSYAIMKDQEYLREIQLPFVRDVSQYCLSLGFWGFCGIDVLFDKAGKGYLVDVNPRVTGSAPSLMVMQLLQEKYGFEYGLFRRSGNVFFPGSSEELFHQVEAYNDDHQGQSRLIVFSVFEAEPTVTKVNIGVYGNSLEECHSALNHFAQSNVDKKPQ